MAIPRSVPDFTASRVPNRVQSKSRSLIRVRDLGRVQSLRISCWPLRNVPRRLINQPRKILRRATLQKERQLTTPPLDQRHYGPNLIWVKMKPIRRLIKWRYDFLQPNMQSADKAPNPAATASGLTEPEKYMSAFDTRNIVLAILFAAGYSSTIAEWYGVLPWDQFPVPFATASGSRDGCTITAFPLQTSSTTLQRQS